MKKFHGVIGLIYMLSSGSVLANIELNLPAEIDLLSVNMHSPQLDGQLFGDKKAELENGENQIVFRYISSFNEREDVTKVYSDVIIAKFTASDVNLSFELPKYKDAKEARKKITHLEWKLVDDSSREIIKQEDILSKAGIQLGRNYNHEATEYNQKGGIAAIGYTRVILPTPHHQTAVDTNLKLENASTISQGSNNLEQLQLWYSKTSKEERKAFKKWMVDQE
ncbi:DUF2057 family protein [Vibrio cholerae]|nr:DUF2057 family protein [Vibrio cholerae]